MSKNINEVLSDLKKLLFEGAPDASTAPSSDMVSVKGKDGVEYYTEKIEVGSVMNTKDEAGAFTPVSAGDYELEDGTKVTVAEGGVIENIVNPEQVAPEEMQAPETPEQFEAAVASFADGTPEERFNKMAVVLQALVKNVFGWQLEENKRKQEMEAALKIMQEGFAKTQREQNTAIFSAIEAIANMPEAESAKQNVKNPFGNDKKADAIAQVQKAFASVNAKK